jgi:hypothetical protein
VNNKTHKLVSFDVPIKRWFSVLSIFVSLILGGVGWISWVVRNIPEKSYVDDLINKELKYIDLKTLESFKYTDDKINMLRLEMTAHSDVNRGAMESEYKGLSSKLDMLIMMVQLREEQRKK